MKTFVGGFHSFEFLKQLKMVMKKLTEHDKGRIELVPVPPTIDCHVNLSRICFSKALNPFYHLPVNQKFQYYR